jgi:pantoate--beta-alanine ligase
MSSRNERLTNELKLKAGKIHETLKWVEESFPKTPLPEIHEKVKEVFENDQDMELEYFIIADENNLKTATTLEKDKKYRAFIVVVVAGVRLIDNMGLKN